MEKLSVSVAILTQLLIADTSAQATTDSIPPLTECMPSMPFRMCEYGGAGRWAETTCGRREMGWYLYAPASEEEMTFLSNKYDIESWWTGWRLNPGESTFTDQRGHSLMSHPKGVGIWRNGHPAEGNDCGVVSNGELHSARCSQSHAFLCVKDFPELRVQPETLPRGQRKITLQCINHASPALINFHQPRTIYWLRKVSYSTEYEEIGETDITHNTFQFTHEPILTQHYACKIHYKLQEGQVDGYMMISNQLQINAVQRCDGNGRFVCADGQRVTCASRCNSYPDCDDQSDEAEDICGAFYTCQGGGGGHQTLTRSQLCDGVNDCYGNDTGDEDNCGRRLGILRVLRAASPPAAGAGTQFTCGDGQALRLYERCDGLAQCTDFSDEMECIECADSSFFYPEHWRCDHKRQCLDNSDEEGCEVKRKRRPTMSNVTRIGLHIRFLFISIVISLNEICYH